jgi:hypothetical protein
MGTRRGANVGNGDTSGSARAQRRPRGRVWVAGDPSTSLVGSMNARWVTGHMLAAQPSWARGRRDPRRSARPPVSGVSSMQLLLRSAVARCGACDPQLSHGDTVRPCVRGFPHQVLVGHLRLQRRGFTRVMGEGCAQRAHKDSSTADADRQGARLWVRSYRAAPRSALIESVEQGQLVLSLGDGDLLELALGGLLDAPSGKGKQVRLP